MSASERITPFDVAVEVEAILLYLSVFASTQVSLSSLQAAIQKIRIEGSKKEIWEKHTFIVTPDEN
jgi:hypothetical protein